MKRNFSNKPKPAGGAKASNQAKKLRTEAENYEAQ
jgi:hypothetical protein